MGSALNAAWVVAILERSLIFLSFTSRQRVNPSKQASVLPGSPHPGKRHNRVQILKDFVVIKLQLALNVAGPFLHIRNRVMEKAVNVVLDEIVTAMVRKDRVELRRFGAFFKG